jgi:hypothetical protein
MTIDAFTSQLGKWPDWLVCLSLCAAGSVMAQSVDRDPPLYANQCMGYSVSAQMIDKTSSLTCPL